MQHLHGPREVALEVLRGHHRHRQHLRVDASEVRQRLVGTTGFW